MESSSKKAKTSDKAHGKDSIEELLLGDLLGDDEKTTVQSDRNQIKLDDEDSPAVKTMSFENYSQFTGLPAGLEDANLNPHEEANIKISSNSEATVQIRDEKKDLPSMSTEKSGESTEFTGPTESAEFPESGAAPIHSNDATIVVSGSPSLGAPGSALGSSQKPKVTLGQHKGVRVSGGQVHTSADASLVQAENLRIAQDRILELEAEIDKLRLDTDEVASAGEIIKKKYEELSQRHGFLEREREDLRETYQAEITLLKSRGDFKDQELAKARIKIDELETRIKQDFRKIRFRERELENRIELIKAEQAALSRSKDDYILDLKRKVDHLESEIENYRAKILEANKLLDGQQEQFKKALRALRLAFTSLEGHLESSQKEVQIVQIKKAE